MNSSLSILFAVCIFSIVTLVLWKYRTQEYWWKNWLQTCASILASALITVPVGISIYNQQVQDEESARRDVFVAIIKQQLEEDLLYLQSNGGIEVDTPKYGKRKISAVPLNENIFEKAAESNLFGGFYTWHFLRLTREIQAYNKWADYFMSVTSNSFVSPNQLEHAILNMDILREVIVEHQEAILHDMKQPRPLYMLKEKQE